MRQHEAEYGYQQPQSVPSVLCSHAVEHANAGFWCSQWATCKNGTKSRVYYLLETYV